MCNDEKSVLIYYKGKQRLCLLLSPQNYLVHEYKQTIDDERKQKRRLSFQREKPVTRLFYRLFFIPIQARSQVHLVMKASPPECIWFLWVTSTEQTSRELSTQPIILTAKCSVTPEGVENDMRQLVLVLERKKCEAITSDWHTDKWMEMW